MSAAHPNADNEGESQRIISPFAQTTSTVQPARSKGPGNLSLWIVSGLLAVVIAGIVGYFTYKYLADPYRTLESFPVDKYLTDYHSLSGAKFKADLKVSADLGWKADTGRLMVFTVEGASRTIAVLVQGDTNFLKDQIYTGELYVSEGGLIHATNLKKD